MQKSLFLDALNCKNFSRPPVWLMRQAGRHLASYRAIRQKHSFLEMCHTPDLIAEVTLLPIEAYGVDAAILFADILLIPEAMGIGLRFEEKIGPVIEKPVRSLADVQKLPGVEEVHSLSYVAEGIKKVLPRLEVPLVGFCGAPFTVASYMIEGGSSRDFRKTKEWMYRDPAGFHCLLEKICSWSVEYLKMQAKAGVHAIQVFDSWANSLAFHQFLEFSLPYLRKIVDSLAAENVPTILFCKGASVFASAIKDVAPSAISFDWNADLSMVRKEIPLPIALQGNLDPAILYADPKTIQREVCYLLDKMEDDPGYIFNLGHGIPPDVPEESVRVLVNTVKNRKSCLVGSLF